MAQAALGSVASDVSATRDVKPEDVAGTVEYRSAQADLNDARSAESGTVARLARQAALPPKAANAWMRYQLGHPTAPLEVPRSRGSGGDEHRDRRHRLGVALKPTLQHRRGVIVALIGGLLLGAAAVLPGETNRVAGGRSPDIVGNVT